MLIQFFKKDQQFTCFDVDDVSYKKHSVEILNQGFSFDGDPIQAIDIEDALNQYKKNKPNLVEKYTKLGLIAGFFGISI
ncbi:hypothetical protein PLEI_3049 [Photobacterium leiognathi lrivu.4.1]|uniref:Uncharacterized protein n=1 Tax=Photobacterium leiognathi lrivu.4.1 TaxID=1248232 RepID=V5F7S9_PHOLE|nr:hypothetical protein [Photobacterium leiognathi]GAD31389.1 hypothetical protein PLEI_3049 [Photobacterium leiognathi lrivu.4.1]